MLHDMLNKISGLVIPIVDASHWRDVLFHPGVISKFLLLEGRLGLTVPAYVCRLMPGLFSTRNLVK